MNRYFTSSLFFLFVFSFHQQAFASPLGDLAASMEPGTFAELTPMTGWDSGTILVPTEFNCTLGDYITQFAGKAAWAPTLGGEGKVLFVGQTHGTCYGGRFVTYDVATNTWTNEPTYPPGICQSGNSTTPCFSHAYDHNTADKVTGDFYYRHYLGHNMFRYRGGAWQELAKPNSGSRQCCGALEYFNAYGALIHLDGDWGLWRYNSGANTWTALANTNINEIAGLPQLPMTNYNNFALENPVHNVMLFGGGTNFYKMDSSGNLTTLNTPPISMGSTYGVIGVDPSSGKYIALEGSSMYEYDIQTDTWQTLSTPIPAEFSLGGGFGDGLVQASLTTYGVIMFVKYYFDQSKVYLYKHSPFTPPPPTPDGTTPSSPTNLQPKS